MRAALLAVGLIVSGPFVAGAQPEDQPYIRYTIKQRCYRHTDMFGAISYPCYRVSVPVRAYAPRVYGYERREEPRRYAPDLHPAPYYGERCKPRIVTAVGFEYASEDRALKSAQLVYASMVRQEYGEMYQEITQARDVLTLCTQASVNDTLIGRLGEATFGENAILKRCKIWARPCRPEIERASFGKDKEDAARKSDPRADYYEPQPEPKKRWYQRRRD